MQAWYVSMRAERRAPGSGGKICWCRRADSNRQPIAYEAIALPLSYCGLISALISAALCLGKARPSHDDGSICQRTPC
jgi:hypothetical protein